MSAETALYLKALSLPTRTLPELVSILPIYGPMVVLVAPVFDSSVTTHIRMVCLSWIYHTCLSDAGPGLHSGCWGLIGHKTGK